MQPQQQRALELLLAGKAIPEIAVEIGVNRVTVWRWTQDPVFGSELRTARAVRAYAVREAIADGALRAAHYLAGVVTDQSVNAGIRVRAAVALLDRADVTASATGPRSVPIEGVELCGELERCADAASRRRVRDESTDRALADMLKDVLP